MSRPADLYRYRLIASIADPAWPNYYNPYNMHVLGMLNTLHSRFADLWSGLHSVLLINSLPFWVAALIDQPIADTARSAGCFEAMKERIQLS